MISDRRMLASGWRKREERIGAVLGGPDQMRALVLACLLALAGCIIDNDPGSRREFHRRDARDLHLRRLDQHGDDSKRRRRRGADPARVARRGAHRPWDVRCRVRRRDAPLRAALGRAIREWRRHRLYRALPVASPESDGERPLVSRVRRRCQRSSSGPEGPWTGSPAGSGTAAICGNARA